MPFFAGAGLAFTAKAFEVPGSRGQSTGGSMARGEGDVVEALAADAANDPLDAGRDGFGRAKGVYARGGAGQFARGFTVAPAGSACGPS